MQENRKRKKKAYYCQNKRLTYQYEIGVGMKGFLITCNNNEAKTVVEAYKVFNEYADKHYGTSNSLDKEDNGIVSDEEDIETELKKHVEGFKNQSVENRRFQNVTTKVKSVVFIKTTLSDPADLVQRIFDDTLESGLAQSRFILRLVPVLETCKAEEEKLNQMCEEQFSKYIEKHECGEEVSYSTLYKIRCNNVINNQMIYACVNKALKKLRPKARVKYDNPDLVIHVNVMPKICCLSILKDYNKYKKYNLNELLMPSKATKETTEDPATFIENASETKSNDEKCNVEQGNEEKEEHLGNLIENNDGDKIIEGMINHNEVISHEDNLENKQDNSPDKEMEKEES